MRARWDLTVLDQRPEWAIDLLVADLDGDGREDIISGHRWYRAPDWEPFDIPGIAQAIAVADIDRDGVLEVIGTRGPGLTSQLCWAKRVDGEWVTYDIGEGGGDWPHGVAWLDDPLTVGRALVTSYHGRGLHPPEIWSAPDDLTLPWIRSTLAEIDYSEEMVVVDLDGDGRMEIVAGPWWLDHAAGGWTAHRFADASYVDVCRVRVADVDGDGRPEVILTEETGDWEMRDPGLGRISMLRLPPDIRDGAWTEHVIARKKCPHSLDLADVDGNGRFAVIVAEHDAFTPDGDATQAELIIYRAPHETGSPWSVEVVDDRFEHFVGAQAIRLGHGIGIVSQGWKVEPRPLYLWQPRRDHGHD